MVETSTEFTDAFENEWFAVRYSGEMPEVALYSAFYYLSEDKDGPRKQLSEEQRQMLVDAAVERFREIVLRDLDHDNRGTRIYRGVQRSLHNWRRFVGFCSRQSARCDLLMSEVREALRSFLDEEILDVERSGRTTCLNCTIEELTEFSGDLRLDLTDIYDKIKVLCPSLAGSYPEEGP